MLSFNSLRPGDVVRPQVDMEVYDPRSGQWLKLFTDEAYIVDKVHRDGRVTVESDEIGDRWTVLAKHLEVVE